MPSVIVSLSIPDADADAVQDVANQRFRGNFSAAVRHALNSEYGIGAAVESPKRKGTPKARVTEDE